MRHTFAYGFPIHVLHCNVKSDSKWSSGGQASDYDNEDNNEDGNEDARSDHADHAHAETSIASC